MSKRPAIPLPKTPEQEQQAEQLKRKGKMGYEDVATPEGKLPDYVNEDVRFLLLL